MFPKAIKGLLILAVAITFMGMVHSAQAQELGRFAWNLDPFCDVLELQVTQHGGAFALNGSDDNCGSDTLLMLTGTAESGPDGSIHLGITLNGIFNEATVIGHVHAILDPTTLSGPWSDDLGSTGTMVFLGPAAPTGPLSGKPYMAR